MPCANTVRQERHFSSSEGSQESRGCYANYLYKAMNPKAQSLWQFLWNLLIISSWESFPFFLLTDHIFFPTLGTSFSTLHSYTPAFLGLTPKGWIFFLPLHLLGQNCQDLKPTSCLLCSQTDKQALVLSCVYKFFH